MAVSKLEKNRNGETLGCNYVFLAYMEQSKYPGQGVETLQLGGRAALSLQTKVPCAVQGRSRTAQKSYESLRQCHGHILYALLKKHINR